MAAPLGHLQELFASFQGEGLTVGVRTVFVRMAGCSLRCRYCDTPKALVRTEECELKRPEGTIRIENPLSVDAVADEVDRLDRARRSWVSLTGGEPLEQPEFLAALAPRLRGRPLHLETAGVHFEAMRALRPLFTLVALDLKLESVAHEGDRAADHARFLAASRGGDRFAKAVIGPATDVEELGQLADLVGAEDPAIPLVLQPETPRAGGPPELPLALLEACHERASRTVRDVRVIPQTHKFLRLP